MWQAVIFPIHAAEMTGIFAKIVEPDLIMTGVWSQRRAADCELKVMAVQVAVATRLNASEP